MNRQVIEIIIDKDANYELKAKEGFAGTSCRQQTQNLEMILGGQPVATKDTEDAYKPDGNTNFENLNLKF